MVEEEEKQAAKPRPIEQPDLGMSVERSDNKVWKQDDIQSLNEQLELQ